MDPKIVASIFANTCAIAWHGPDFDPSTMPERAWPGTGIPVYAVGTGFLISPRVVVTAAHVVKSIRARGVATKNICVCVATPPTPPALRGNIEIRGENAIAFVGVILPGGEQTKIGELHSASDIAFITLKYGINDDPTEVRPPPYAIPQGLKFADPTSIGLLDPVVVAGYMLGQKMIAMPGSTTMRYGPLLLSGHVAAIAPVSLRGQDGDSDYWIDVTCERGLSGGPVCNMSGEVIGMVTSGPVIDLDKVIPGEVISRGLARALPLNERLIGPIRGPCEQQNLPSQPLTGVSNADGYVEVTLPLPEEVLASVKKT